MLDTHWCEITSIFCCFPIPCQYRRSDAKTPSCTNQNPRCFPLKTQSNWHALHAHVIRQAINYGSVVDLKTSIHKWHSCMQQSPLCTLYFHAVFLKRLHTALPHQSSSMALAKRANGKWTVGAPAGFSAHVLFMSMGRRDAPRHTPCQKHTLSCAPEPLTTFPFQISSYPLKTRDIFTLCAPILPSKEGDNSNSQP